LNSEPSLSVFKGVTRNPVTVTVAYRVVPGREAEFHSWGWGVLRAGAQQPGFLGGGVLVDGEAEWHVVYRFISEGSALAWEGSAERAQLQAGGEKLARETGRRTVQGSRAWFDSQAETASATAAAPRPPPKWKLWFVNMSAVFPPVLVFNLAILPYLGSLNPLIRTLLLCLAVTAIVTWILMPRLQRFFKKWLYPPLQAMRGRHKRRAAQG
jgi:antibiotic biosynthesis monooxygenase (ABM) superfamily enzyme